LTLIPGAWSPIGPTPIKRDIEFNGLVSAIEVNPSNPDIIYIGTGSGGLWRGNRKRVSEDFDWIPLFDRQLNLGIGEPRAVAIDPKNTSVIYAGISNRVNKEPSQRGLFKSTDGGYSWVRLGSGYPLGNTGNAMQLFLMQNINVVIVDPVNTSTLYLASDQGVFRSTDGGLNWTQGKTPTGNVPGIAFSLVLDSSTTGARILYAGVLGIGVFGSSDGGLNWTQILSSATTGVQPPFGKVQVDIAPPTSPPNSAGVQIIYVAIRGIGGVKDRSGIFVSRDQGVTWSQQSGIDLNSQADYCFHMAVDPGSPGDGINDIIYWGGVKQLRSDDSGVTFTDIKQGIHADTHAWAFAKQPNSTPSIVYCGNDGGLFQSNDRGTTWKPHNKHGLQTALFYNVTLKPPIRPSDGTPYYINVGAFQDNGVNTTANRSQVGEWRGTLGGDGGDVAYDKDGRVLYASNWGGGTWVNRSTDDGLTFTEITPWKNDPSTDPGEYIASIATDPNTSGIVYVSGSRNLYQSFNNGSTWRAITSFSTSCDDIDVALDNGNNVVIAIDSQVFVSTNALAGSGVTFTNITSNLPNRFVTRVRFDPNDPSTIYAVLAGFNSPTDPSDKGHIFRTNIYGSSWIDISPIDFDAPFSALALEPEFPTRINVGTEFGVLRSVDGGSSWFILDDIHFPYVPVIDLEYSYGRLVAATYGRGAFEFSIYSGQPVIALNLERNLAFGPVRQGPVYLTLQIFNVGDPGEELDDVLIIDSVQRLMGSSSFSVLPSPGTPLTVSAGEHVDFTVMYDPNGAGIEETATIRIISNDPYAPYVDVSATGLQEAYD
jgi:hypothetical protein